VQYLSTTPIPTLPNGIQLTSFYQCALFFILLLHLPSLQGIRGLATCRLKKEQTCSRENRALSFHQAALWYLCQPDTVRLSGVSFQHMGSAAGTLNAQFPLR